ncbi:peptide/nickel transport system permease protein [Clostridiales Family XIII bacterium PM5-7]
MKKTPLVILLVIFAASVFAGTIAPFSPETMNTEMISQPPGGEYLFGTDSMGRDLFSLVLYGGRASLYIGLLSGLIATALAIVYGTISGLAGKRLDDFLMRLVELLMSVPSILLIIFLQAIWGNATYTSLSVVIGVTSWMNISKMVRSEVKQLRSSDYLLAAKTMEAGFWYMLRVHLLPNFISSIMFMVVTNIGQAMITESTLSFLGLGLPLSAVSWGSLLSMSQEMLLSNCWWIIVIPGAVLIVTLVCITEIGEQVRQKTNRLYSNL